MERQIYNYTIPKGYNENKIVLMVRDPNCLFVYWEITDYRRNLVSRHLNSDWKDLTPIIRLYDVTDKEFDGYNANYYLEIKVHPMANNWYIHDITPDRTFVADYGVLNEKGHYMSILRSNDHSTPWDREAHLDIPVILPSQDKHKSDQSTVKEKNVKQNTVSSYSIYEK